METKDFEAFKMNWTQKQWMKVKSSGDELLFMGRNGRRHQCSNWQFYHTWESDADHLGKMVSWIVRESDEEIDLSQDMQYWEALFDSEKHFINLVLAFFVASDGIVVEILAARFLNDVKIPEAFYVSFDPRDSFNSSLVLLLLEIESHQKGLIVAIKLQVLISE
ncbi:unnamed protein product [Dovyalis caffra]|uniref:Uncharacterized protein n=1 Tax=Dovyalis caffra TaxID=77055 RepID=A0AAV1SQD6_9ROSI|nr:unnamed protein product [Dovyalis caffra]